MNERITFYQRIRTAVLTGLALTAQNAGKPIDNLSIRNSSWGESNWTSIRTSRRGKFKARIRQFPAKG